MWVDDITVFYNDDDPRRLEWMLAKPDAITGESEVLGELEHTLN